MHFYSFRAWILMIDKASFGIIVACVMEDSSSNFQLTLHHPHELLCTKIPSAHMPEKFFLSFLQQGNISTCNHSLPTKCIHTFGIFIYIYDFYSICDTPQYFQTKFLSTLCNSFMFLRPTVAHIGSLQLRTPLFYLYTNVMPHLVRIQ